jgi:hypothetical protein
MQIELTAALLVVATALVCGCGDGEAAVGGDGGSNEAGGVAEADGPETSVGEAAGADTGTDGAATGHDGAVGDDAPAGFDAPSNGVCTPVTEGMFYCGPVMCSGTTSYCLEGNRGNTCLPMPSACQCAETRGCDCMLANVANPCDSGVVRCEGTLDDGGLFLLQALSCP